MANSVKLPNQENAKALVYLGIGLVVIVVLIIAVGKGFKGLDSILEALGLKDSKEKAAEKAKIQAAIDASNNNPGTSPFTASAASARGITASTPLPSDQARLNLAARNLYDSVGVFTDNAQAGLGAIKTMKTKLEMSVLVIYFNELFSRDLISWLQEHYDTNDQLRVLDQIVTYANGLPAGRLMRNADNSLKLIV